MSTKNLMKIEKQLATPKTIKAMLQLDLVRDRFITNYEKTTGHKDGPQRYEQEIFNYMEIVNANEKLQKADRFSHFAAIVKAGTTGLSFGEGHLYPIPRYSKDLKKVIVYTQIGNYGKRELLQRQPDIIRVDEAQVVFKKDEFAYDKLSSKVTKHVSVEIDGGWDDITAAYVRVHFTDKTIKDVMLPKSQLVIARSKAPTDNIWKENPIEMCKKSCYGRAYKAYRKTQPGQYSEYPQYDDETNVDDNIEEAEVVEEEANPTLDPEKVTGEPDPKGELDLVDLKEEESSNTVEEPEVNDRPF